MHPLREDAWLAGFVDGEGCLQIAVRNSAFGAYLRPTLTVALRDDDGPILRELQAAFGGSLEVHRMASPSQARFNARPQIRWQVADKDHLLLLVGYFDVFPLLAKKAREYPIWREAVFAYLEEGGKSPKLVEAKMELSRLKQYTPEAVAA